MIKNTTDKNQDINITTDGIINAVCVLENNNIVIFAHGYLSLWKNNICIKTTECPKIYGFGHINHLFNKFIAIHV
jgi:hypothetical protein